MIVKFRNRTELGWTAMNHKIIGSNWSGLLLIIKGKVQKDRTMQSSNYYIRAFTNQL